MPGRDLGQHHDTNSPTPRSLKAHKSLPKPKSEASRTRKHDVSKSRYSNPDNIESWIPPPSSSHMKSPLEVQATSTPLNGGSSYQSWIDDERLRNSYFGPQALGAGTNQTPESLQRRSSSGPLKNSTGEDLGSVADVSRTESFKTAVEQRPNSEDSQEPGETDLQLRKNDKDSFQPGARSRNVGLGLGLESDDENTPMATTPRASAEDEDFIAFEGVWGGDTPSRINSHLQDQRTRHHTDHTPLVDTGTSSPSDDPVTAVEPSHSTSVTPPLNFENEGRSEASTGELTVIRHEGIKENELKAFEAEVQDIDAKRSSHASTNSTVIAAIIDAPLQRRQTLRHTGRIIDPTKADSNTLDHLRKVSPSLRRRQPKHIQQPESNLRRKFSEAAKSTPSKKTEPPPPSLLVMPDRRSSLTSSAPSSKRLSNTFSRSSHQASSRPTTAPEEVSNNYFDAPKPHRRSISVVIQQARPLRHSTKLARDPLSPIQQSSHPTSTQPSQEPSRSTSITSAGLKTHYVPATPSTLDEDSSPKIQGEVNDPRRETLTDNHPQAEMVTPFSLRSTHSSTPGTLEVNEATALSIHPHNNKSILVIQQTASRDEQGSRREQSAVLASNANIAFSGALKPEFLDQSPRISYDLTGSPLVNPREPPPPPDLIKVIPPTPANAFASSDAIVAAGDAARANRRGTNLAGIRRAFSARQPATTGESVTTRTSLSRTFSLKPSSKSFRRRYSFTSSDDRPSHLYPSWRPRHSQNSFSDSDSEFGDGVLRPTPALSRKEAGRPRRSLSLTNRISNVWSRGPRRAASVSGTYPVVSSTVPLPYDAVDDAIKRRHQTFPQRLTNSIRRASERFHPGKRYTFTYEGKEREVRPQDIQHQNDVHDDGSNFTGHRPDMRSQIGSIKRKWDQRVEQREQERAERRRDEIRGKIDVLGTNQQV